ncbi:hypothetical protein FRB99_004352, partial [Tulasnella sp. 403]
TASSKDLLDAFVREVTANARTASRGNTPRAAHAKARTRTPNTTILILPTPLPNSPALHSIHTLDQSSQWLADVLTIALLAPKTPPPTLALARRANAPATTAPTVLIPLDAPAVAAARAAPALPKARSATVESITPVV